MSVSYIPQKVKTLLWVKSGGRCEYEGCNKILYIDDLTKLRFNNSYIAHIIADKPKGPRGDKDLSEKLKGEFSNLMLLCDTHHRLIDKIDVKGHTIDKLRVIKNNHEERIKLLTSIHSSKKSEILLYGAKIGQQNVLHNYDLARLALIPEYFPASEGAIELGMKNSAYDDSESEYWEIEIENLRRLYKSEVVPKISSSRIQHLSIFGLAPIPLLIELGKLLSDLIPAEVYQLHRNPQNWNWIHSNDELDFKITEPKKIEKNVCIILSLSANINHKRISDVIKEPHSLWELTIRDPNNDFLKGRSQLQNFREIFKTMLNRIKLRHGEETILNLFPAVPVAVAIEIGRVWMPKADLPLNIYDQNKKIGGFHFVHRIE